MEYVIMGGDERFACLARLMKRRGMQVCTALRGAVPEVPSVPAEAIGSARSVIVNLPPKGDGGMPGMDDILQMAPDYARIYTCGPRSAEGYGDRRVVDLWADELLKRENAWLTAEGALSAAMRASRTALKRMRCMVIGWGRIGRALTELLEGVGARVCVASRDQAHRNRAAERGAQTVDTGELIQALPGKRLIFNTAPAMVLDGEALRHADDDAMIVDLASPPYGVDLRAAWARGLRAWREPALPGRYCPESAAAALLAALLRSEREADYRA